MPSPIVQARLVANMGVHYVLKRRLSNREVGSVPESWLHDRLDRYDSDTVFVHVGLSDVNSAFEGNPYEFLRSVLREHFDTVLAPGFTDYFERSGLYHKTFSRPPTGAFPRLLLGDAEYRTDDAMRSFVVDGPRRFEDCEPWNSYGAQSPFAVLEAENVPILNVGTPWFKCSQLHYLEYQYDVPYMEERELSGVVYRTEDGSPEEITQTFGAHTSTNAFNRWKLQRRLEKDGVLDSYAKNGLTLTVTGAADLRDALGPRLSSDPYYLVT